MAGITDDELVGFDEDGPAALPADLQAGTLERQGARIWYGSVGQGPAVVFLHGGMGNSTNWGYQVPAVLDAGYRAILVDSRGQGRSSHDGTPLSYRAMAADTLAVLDQLGVEKAAFIGWSDGACIALLLAQDHPERCAGVFFFACNVDPAGTKPFIYTDRIGRCLSRHRKDFTALSPTPDAFDAVFAAVNEMQATQPNLDRKDLERIAVPVWSVLSADDEFITMEHGRYLADAIPAGSFHELSGVSHFAPVQRPPVFNGAMLDFLAKVLPTR